MRITLPNQNLLDRLRERLDDDVDLQLWPLDGPPPTSEGIDLAVLPYMAAPELLEVLHGVDVAAIQSQSLGYDGMTEVLPENVVLCNAHGVHEDATAELTLALVLASERNLTGYIAHQAEGCWDQHYTPGLIGRTVLVVGAGGVGAAIADRLRVFGVRLLRSASRARADEHGAITGPEELTSQVAQADVVILVTPLTASTRGLFGEEMIARMKSGALLVNVGRGPLIDTDALTEACRQGRIRAALDVMDPEPLPPDHPLWTTPGVLITPHVGGWSTSMGDRVVDLVVRQTEHLRAGEDLENRVL